MDIHSVLSDSVTWYRDNVDKVEGQNIVDKLRQRAERYNDPLAKAVLTAMLRQRENEKKLREEYEEQLRIANRNRYEGLKYLEHSMIVYGD